MMKYTNREGLEKYELKLLNATREIRAKHPNIRVFQGILRILLENVDLYFDNASFEAIPHMITFFMKPDVLRDFSDVEFIKEFFKSTKNHIVLNENDKIEHIIVDEFDPKTMAFEHAFGSKHMYYLGDESNDEMLFNVPPFTIIEEYSKGYHKGRTYVLIQDENENYYEYLSST